MAAGEVYDNLIAGCRIGIRDYSEGALTNPHGLKNTLIANNTIIMPATTPPNTYTAGIQLQDNGTANTNSFIVSNAIYGFDNTEPVIWSMAQGAISGIALDNNGYYNPGSTTPFWQGSNIVNNLTFAQWQQQLGADVHGLFADPKLVGVAQFQAAGTTPYSYLNAMPTSGSPLIGNGVTQSAFSTNLLVAARAGVWSIGAF
uniref:Right handed beta helix domain-containing protein n=1 Tax=mine drainage metagenome TaxID=410659 RepID=E6PUZ8_9ZZZZ